MKEKIELSEFSFLMPIHIRWNDLDALGHVNNVLYIDYFQNARGEYMSTASKTWDWNKNMFVVANINCNYWKEMRLDVKNAQIGVRVSQIGTKSFVLEYVILSEKENGEKVIHATGQSTQVMIDVRIGKSIEFPDWLREEFSSYESSLKIK